MSAMKSGNKITWLLCVLLLWGQYAQGQKVGTTSMQWLKVMPCARATAMGDAYSVLGTGAEALFWNPSGLALTHGQDFSSTYTVWIFDARQGALAYAFDAPDIGSFGL